MKLFSEKISIKETNILLKVDDPKFFKIAKNKILEERAILENYIFRNPIFLTSYSPVEVPENSEKIIKLMAEAGFNADVGPMAAVAGTFSELLVESLLENNASYNFV